MEQFYFSKYEKRKPYKPVPDNQLRTIIFQLIGIITIMLGCSYLYWRWVHSLNPDAMWFALPLVLAETMSFIGTVLMIFNCWSNKDPAPQSPIHYVSDMESLKGRKDRPVKIDVFIASYNEEVELVRYSVRDAKQMRYPHDDVSIKVYVLDDGRRDGRDPEKENMKKVAEEEGVGYFSREDNEGYKAGNLKNALEQTDGDLFVILDADTRPFPSFLENTTGYFRNRKLAWVQTPQWFYDINPPVSLNRIIRKNFRAIGARFGKLIDFLFKGVKVGEDIFGNDPRMFYEVILRKRNNYNAAFCCGAGSIHRREAVMNLAMKDFMEEVNKETFQKLKSEVSINLNDLEKYRKETFIKEKVKPFKFHASEDIYTSMMMHCDRKKWQSIQHPQVECKMLSPQDLDSCIKQRTRYASGSLDIAFKNNPLFIKGLDIWQRLSYFNTIWSYFSPLWVIVLLLSPVVYFYTLALPVKAFSFDFFKWFLSFQIMNALTMMLASWGVSGKRGEQYYIASFWLVLRSLFSAIKGEKVKFNVTPKDRQWGNNLQHIWPHLTIIGLTIVGVIYNMVLINMDLHPSWSGFASNFLWSVFNIYNLTIMVRAALWSEEIYSEKHDSADKKIKLAMEIQA